MKRRVLVVFQRCNEGLLKLEYWFLQLAPSLISIYLVTNSEWRFKQCEEAQFSIRFYVLFKLKVTSTDSDSN